jgi:hypothetical protein
MIGFDRRLHVMPLGNFDRCGSIASPRTDAAHGSNTLKADSRPCASCAKSGSEPVQQGPYTETAHSITSSDYLGLRLQLAPADGGSN